MSDRDNSVSTKRIKESREIAVPIVSYVIRNNLRKKSKGQINFFNA